MSDSIDIQQIEVGMMQNFAYIVGDKESGEAIVIDPSGDPAALLDAASVNGLELKAVFLTHGHYDHTGGIKELGLPVYLSREEFALYVPRYKNLVRTIDGDRIPVGSLTITCIATPGHTPGCQCFLIEGNLFTGDTLFVEAVGRSDLPGGDNRTLFQSLERVKTLPDDTVIWPGHDYGAVTHDTLKNLKRTNPYLK